MGLFGSGRSFGTRLFARSSDRDRGSNTPLSAEAISRLARSAATVRSMGIAEEVAGALVESFGLVGAAIYRKSQNGTLRLANRSGPIAAPDEIDSVLLPELTESFIPWEMFCTAQSVVAEPSSTLWAGLPLRYEGTLVGLVGLGSKCTGEPFDDRESALLSLFSTHLALVLQGYEWVHQISQQGNEIALLQQRLQSETAVIHTDIECAPNFPYIIGSSVSLQAALSLVEKIAHTDTTVLITGETGTGKELIARAIHELSARRCAPLVSVNCPAIPLELAESELFGHERGAFTGAVDARAGKMEQAHGGTIFLDEVADLPMAVQVKLLRVLQEREIQRVGSQRTRRLDIRIIAATNRDLIDAVEHGLFREDLYYRLAAMPIDLPPLRDRMGDIPVLATYFLDEAARRYHKPIRGFTTEAIAAIESHHWPGNVRELQNVIERAVLFCTSDRIALAELPLLKAPAVSGTGLASTMRAEKRRRVEAALVQTEGNQAAAARLLGMSRSNFARLVKTLGLRVQKRAA